MKSDVAMDEAPGSRSSEAERILIVESDGEVALEMSRALARGGFHVERCAPREDVVERIRELMPRLVIYDVLLPQLDGFALCRELKSSPETARIGLVLTSFLAAEDRALEAGADAFLLKHASPERLIEIVRDALG